MKPLSAILLAFTGLLFLTNCSKESDFSVTNDASDVIATDRGPTVQNINGQSVQVNVEGLETVYQIDESGHYNYDWNTPAAAEAAFDTYFTFSATGGTPGSNAYENAVKNAKFKAFQDNDCNFWWGNPLVEVVRSQGGTTVTCTPKSTEGYPAKTGWSLVGNSGGGTATVDVDLSNIFIASVSYLKKAKANSGWSKKYSFTMIDGGISRLTALKIELLHDDVVIETRNFEYPTLIPVETGVNWEYNSLGVYYGDSGAVPALEYAEGKMVNETQGTNEFDDFAGNNGTGGSRAMVGNQSFPSLALEGNYKVRISGVIKGNGFVSDQPFSITKNVVTSGGCK